MIDKQTTFISKMFQQFFYFASFFCIIKNLISCKKLFLRLSRSAKLKCDCLAYVTSEISWVSSKLFFAEIDKWCWFEYNCLTDSFRNLGYFCFTCAFGK